MFLRKPNDENPEPRTIPGCGTKCPLEKFYSTFEHLIPGDFKEECDSMLRAIELD